MDTVNLVLMILAGLALSNIVSLALAARFWYRGTVAQRELTRLEARLRPRSPHHPSAGYDTGLIEDVRST